mmetsp:Transcript_2144/g.4879  ORF Transcript_2144/g.4879 Transcript_2144/m.4879 type:complete len:111 (-) Transcript_2144:360-692(-)
MHTAPERVLEKNTTTVYVYITMHVLCQCSLWVCLPKECILPFFPSSLLPPSLTLSVSLAVSLNWSLSLSHLKKKEEPATHTPPSTPYSHTVQLPLMLALQQETAERRLVV